MTNWRKLSKQIPFRVQVSKKSFYEVVYVDDFPDGETVGEARYEQKQIALKKDLSPKLKVITYLHELDHVFSYETGANLTENQVLANEKSYYYRLKLGNIFNDGNE